MPSRKKSLESMHWWSKLMPVLIVILLAMLIGALQDLKAAKAAAKNANSYLSHEPGPALGKISYKEARALYDQLKQPVWDTGVFDKKSFKERTEYIDQARALADKFEVFGTPSQCRSAALSRVEYIYSLHNFANVKEGLVNLKHWNDLANPMYNAFNFGDHVAGCYYDVEALNI